MNAIVAAATAELADLAYDVYAETLDDLRSIRAASLEILETVQHLADSTGGFEAAALTFALRDYLADLPPRSREHFCRIVVAPRAERG
jgi:hypothetical protein